MLKVGLEIADGCYRAQMVAGGPFVPVRLFSGPPLCPWTGEPLDRSPRRQIDINGQVDQFDAERLPQLVWRSLEPIDRAEFDYLTAMRNHAMKYEPALPQASPRKPVDFKSLKFDFGGQS